MAAATVALHRFCFSSPVPQLVRYVPREEEEKNNKAESKIDRQCQFSFSLSSYTIQHTPTRMTMIHGMRSSNLIRALLFVGFVLVVQNAAVVVASRSGKLMVR